MPVYKMETSRFCQIYGGPGRISAADSPEIEFMKAVTENRIEKAMEFFEDRQQFQGLSHVDCPHGRYEGIEAIREFCDTWLDRLHFISGEVEPVVQTRSAGRSVIEFVLHGTRADGTVLQVPMIAVGELRNGGKKLNTLHIYFQFKWFEDYPKYRPPVFPACSTHELRHEMLSGIMPYYMKKVHEDGMQCIPDLLGGGEILSGGYGPDEPAHITSAEEMRAMFNSFKEKTGLELPPMGLGEIVKLRMETITDDGCRCCVEWEQLVTKKGRQMSNRLSQAGMSVYERDENGDLKSVRIVDYANTENEIDWENTPYDKEWAYALNYLDE